MRSALASVHTEACSGTSCPAQLLISCMRLSCRDETGQGADNVSDKQRELLRGKLLASCLACMQPTQVLSIVQVKTARASACMCYNKCQPGAQSLHGPPGKVAMRSRQRPTPAVQPQLSCCASQHAVQMV